MRGPWWSWIAHLSRSFPQNEFYLLCSHVQIRDPQDGASFDPRDIIWIQLGEVHKEMLHTENQSSTPFSFRGEEFWSWSSLFLYSNLWPKGHYVNKIDRGLQGDAKYQISKLYTFWFQRRRILKLVFFVHMFQLVTPGVVPVFDPRVIIWTTW